MSLRTLQSLRNAFIPILVYTLVVTAVILLAGCSEVRIAHKGCAGEIIPASPPYIETKITSVVCDNGQQILVEIPIE